MGDRTAGSHLEKRGSLSWPSPGDAPRSRTKHVGRFVVAAVLGIAVLTGCGDEDGPPPETNDTGDDAAPEQQDGRGDSSDAAESSAADGAADADDEVATDIRATDWIALTWQANCDTTASIEFELAPDDESDARRYTATAPADGVDTYQFGVDLDEVVYTDVTGDGREEAAFLAYCVPGNYSVETVEVWRLTDGELEQLPPVVTHDPGSGIIAGIDALEGAVQITTLESDPGEDAALIEGAFPIEVVTDWQFDGDSWQGTEISREAADSESDTEPDLATDGFVLPSGNIACVRRVTSIIDTIDDLACVILSGTQPPLGDACDAPEAMWLPRSGPPWYGCERDEPVDTDQPTLSYGARWANEGVGCVARETGLECTNGSGHGFWLSRNGWRSW